MISDENYSVIQRVYELELTLVDQHYSIDMASDDSNDYILYFSQVDSYEEIYNQLDTINGLSIRRIEMRTIKMSPHSRQYWAYVTLQGE